MSTRVVLVPGTLALLPEYASLSDPVEDLRAACLRAVEWLGTDVTVLADEQGTRIAEALLAATTRQGDRTSYLVVGNGSNCRTEKAPGYLDERAPGFDRDLRSWLGGEGPPVDADRAEELGAALTGPTLMAERLRCPPPVVDYEDDPYGVQWWVMRWRCES